MSGVHPLAAIALLLAPVAAPQPLERIEIREPWQAAFLTRHGFRPEYLHRGKRLFMVRRG